MTSDDDLLSGYFDEALDEVDLIEVQQRLTADPAFAKRFVALSRLHTNVRLLGQDRAAIERHGVSPPRPLTRSHRRRALTRRRSRSAFPLIAFISAAAVFIALVMLQTTPGQSDAQHSYELIADGGTVVVVLPNGSQTLVQDRLRMPNEASITTQTAGARLVAADGSEITIAAASVIKLSGLAAQPQVGVEQGSATFHISPQEGTHTFQAHADSLAVTVIGTRFRLENDHLRSMLSVEQGMVEARVANGSPFRLSAGQLTTANRGAFLCSDSALSIHGQTLWQWRDARDASIDMGELIDGPNGRHLQAAPADIPARPGITTPAPYALCAWEGTAFPKLGASDYLIAQVKSGRHATWIGAWMAPNALGSNQLHIETKAVPETWMTLVVPIHTLLSTNPKTSPLSETAVQRLVIQGDGDDLLVRDIRMVRVP